MMSQKSVLLILIAGIFLGHFAHAADGAGSQFGVVYGRSVPDSENTNPRRLIGAKGSAYLAPIFSMGGYLFESNSEEGTGGTKFNYSLHGLEGAFHLGGGSGDTYVALRVGLSKIRTDVAGVDAIFSPYHYGISTGYDYPVTSWLSVGFEGSFLHVEKGNTHKSGNSYHLDAFSIINFLACLQLRL